MVSGADPTGNDLFPRFSQAEFDRRHRAVRQAMAREDLECLIVYGGPWAPEVSYLINYLPASPCWLVSPRQGEATIFLHFYNHIPCTRAQAIIDDVRCYGPAPMEPLANHPRHRELAQGRIGLVSLNTIAYNHYMDLQRRLPEVKFTEFGRQYNTIRWVRSMVHVIQPNPVTRDLKAGLQLGAAVVVRPDGGEPLHNYPLKFPVCGLEGAV